MAPGLLKILVASMQLYLIMSITVIVVVHMYAFYLHLLVIF